MKIDSKGILAKLSVGKKGDREKTSLYLSKSVYEAFKKACGDVPLLKSWKNSCSNS